MLDFVTDERIYEKVICGLIPDAKKFVWLATANLKDLYVRKRRRMVPFLEILSDLVDRRVEIRLLHARKPGPAFTKDFGRYPNLAKGIEMMLCPRTHIKCALVDGKFAYTGSANLTGAGMGAKTAGRRNFEAGVITDDSALVGQIMRQFDDIWRGACCRTCKRKEFCAGQEDVPTR